MACFFFLKHAEELSWNKSNTEEKIMKFFLKQIPTEVSLCKYVFK